MRTIKAMTVLVRTMGSLVKLCQRNLPAAAVALAMVLVIPLTVAVAALAAAR
jgi:hypothetical protein